MLFRSKTTANKILRAGFYWPTLFHDIHKMIIACHKCQIFEGKRKLLPLPLHPITVEAPFQWWGLDFIGEIHPPSSSQHRWILTATNYFTKWIEAIPCIQANDSVIIKFMETKILSRFGCPTKLSLITQQHLDQRRWLSSIIDIKKHWGIPRPITLKVMDLQNPQTRV